VGVSDVGGREVWGTDVGVRHRKRSISVCATSKSGTSKDYGVATVSRIDKIIGLFYRI